MSAEKKKGYFVESSAPQGTGVQSLRPMIASADQLRSLVHNDPELLEKSTATVLREAGDRAKMQFFFDQGVDIEKFDAAADGPWDLLMARMAHWVAGGALNEEPKAGGAFARNVQLVTVPVGATWDDPKYGPHRLCKSLGDAMPKWGATYEPASGNSFGDGYGWFVQSLLIKAPTDAQQREIEEAREGWQTALLKLRDHESGVGDRWKKFDDKQKATLPPQKHMPFDIFFEKYEKPIIGAMQTAVNGKRQKFIKKVNDYTGGFGVVADMISRYSDERAKFYAPSEGTGDDRLEHLYRYTVDQSLADFKTTAAGQPADAISWAFNKSSFRLHASETRWGGSASYGFFVRAGASGSSSHLDWHSDSFQLKFRARAIQRFNVQPGDWYAGQLFKMYAKGPFVPGSVADNFDKSGTLWGERGKLSLRTASLVVVHSPAIELSVSRQDYERNYSSWSASGSLGIGPFSFGASAGGSSEDIKYDAASCTVTAVDTTGIPKVVAVIADVLPDLT